MDDVLVPIFVCCVLPVAVVLIVSLSKVKNNNKRAEVIMKAIESNSGVDADKLAEALAKPRKTPRQILNERLLRGCMFTFVGVLLLVIALVAFLNGVEFDADPVAVPALFGGVSLAVGLSYLVVYLVTHKQVKD